MENHVNSTENNAKKTFDLRRKTFLISLILQFVIGAFLFLLVIMFLRSFMNAANRASFIDQRLDDYPRLYDNYRRENEEWWDWWQDRDYEKLADLAGMIFTEDRKHAGEEDKLAYIAKVLGAKEASIVSSKKSPEFARYQEGERIISSETLPDGRVLVLVFHTSVKENRMALQEDDDSFIRRLQAGLEGPVVIQHEGELYVYPEDEEGLNVKTMVQEMLSDGSLNPSALREKAKLHEDGAALNITQNSGTSTIPAWRYLLYTAAYRDNDDFVVHAVRLSAAFRFGRKRSWSLWFLCTAIMGVLGLSLWRTRLYHPEDEERQTKECLHQARVRGASALFIASVLLFMCVLFIQLLSNVNQSEDASVDEALYLQNVLQEKSLRAEEIEDEFEEMYNARLQSAAQFLADNSELIDANCLGKLCDALGGETLSVYDTEGNLIVSNMLLRADKKDDQSKQVYSAVLQDADGNSIGTLQLNAVQQKDDDRIYRALMVGEDQKTHGFVELRVNAAHLDELLQATRMKDVIGDMHLLDTIHVVVLDHSKDHLIVAGTYPSWIGDKAEEYGIHTQAFYDGYEGIVNFGGNKCYSKVFVYDDYFVVTGSEDVSMLVFLIGVFILFIVLAVVMTLLIYRPLTKRFYEYQRSESLVGVTGTVSRSEYPLMWEFIRNFMLSVFVLSTVLYFLSKGNPTGLTYKVVRGTWVRGISVVSVTTCVMLVSVVFAAQMLIDNLFTRLSRFLSPKGQTICKLINSGMTYVGAIVMIIYTLSMFGVNTTTLVGGVGATALVFTLGANSLIADVLAGLFIIFEGDFTVGDVVVVDGFRGIVTDISMRTTKLMDDDTKDIRILSTRAGRSRSLSSI